MWEGKHRQERTYYACAYSVGLGADTFHFIRRSNTKYFNRGVGATDRHNGENFYLLTMTSRMRISIQFYLNVRRTTLGNNLPQLSDNRAPYPRVKGGIKSVGRDFDCSPLTLTRTYSHFLQPPGVGRTPGWWRLIYNIPKRKKKKKSFRTDLFNTGNCSWVLCFACLFGFFLDFSYSLLFPAWSPAK